MDTVQHTGSPEEAGVTQLMQRICISLGFTDNRNFLNKAAFKWLVQGGYATVHPRTDNSLLDHRPTPKGEAIGLRAVEYKGPQGQPYLTLVCGEQGQQLLQDNTEQIMALEREQWEPLLACLTPEWHSWDWDFGYHELEKLATKINDRLPANLPRRLSTNNLRRWLFWKDFLEESTIRGTRYITPTEAGERIGIYINTPVIQKPVVKIIYGPRAQQFILDNLETIIEDLASGEAYRPPVRIRPPKPERFVVTKEMLEWMPMGAGEKGEGFVRLADRINMGFQGVGMDFELPWQAIAAWLISNRYLKWSKVHPTSPKKRLFSTPKGENIGITYEPDGEWIRFNMDAQNILLDHMQEIVDFYFDSLDDPKGPRGMWFRQNSPNGRWF